MWKSVFLIFYLSILSILDGKEKKIPVIGLTVGIAVVFAAGIYGIVKEQLWMQYIMGLIPGLVLFFVALATKKIGYADGIVLAVVGGCEGFKNCILILCVSLFAISICSLLLLFLKKVQKNSMIPFIPFLCAGYMFWKVVEGIN